jgi:hypothetical protein
MVILVGPVLAIARGDGYGAGEGGSLGNDKRGARMLPMVGPVESGLWSWSYQWRGHVLPLQPY